MRQVEQSELVERAESLPGVREIAELAAAIAPIEQHQPQFSFVVTTPAISTNA